MISVNGLAATMSYDVGYDVAQGVLLSLNICLFVAILFQFLVEYRVSQDQRLFQSTNTLSLTAASFVFLTSNSRLPLLWSSRFQLHSCL